MPIAKMIFEQRLAARRHIFEHLGIELDLFQALLDSVRSLGEHGGVGKTTRILHRPDLLFGPVEFPGEGVEALLDRRSILFAVCHVFPMKKPGPFLRAGRGLLISRMPPRGRSHAYGRHNLSWRQEDFGYEKRVRRRVRAGYAGTNTRKKL